MQENSCRRRGFRTKPLPCKGCNNSGQNVSAPSGSHAGISCCINICFSFRCCHYAAGALKYRYRPGGGGQPPGGLLPVSVDIRGFSIQQPGRFPRMRRYDQLCPGVFHGFEIIPEQIEAVRVDYHRLVRRINYFFNQGAIFYIIPSPRTDGNGRILRQVLK
ncbi:hypothetical protein SDC9_172922 [bioreactor metagenome]|uniref:Uncharacterized protein n=1 Tax=bioreactor metagenome TaxID=1076179 RepID=A0A645GF18_9ZZZZ